MAAVNNNLDPIKARIDAFTAKLTAEADKQKTLEADVSLFESSPSREKWGKINKTFSEILTANDTINSEIKQIHDLIKNSPSALKQTHIQSIRDVSAPFQKNWETRSIKILNDMSHRQNPEKYPLSIAARVALFQNRLVEETKKQKSLESDLLNFDPKAPGNKWKEINKTFTEIITTNTEIQREYKKLTNRISKCSLAKQSEYRKSITTSNEIFWKEWEPCGAKILNHIVAIQDPEKFPIHISTEKKAGKQTFSEKAKSSLYQNSPNIALATLSIFLAYQTGIFPKALFSTANAVCYLAKNYLAETGILATIVGSTLTKASQAKETGKQLLWINSGSLLSLGYVVHLLASGTI